MSMPGPRRSCGNFHWACARTCTERGCASVRLNRAWWKPNSRWCGRAAIRARPMRSMVVRSEEHTSELQSLMRISYAVFCLKKKKKEKSRHRTMIHNTTQKQKKYIASKQNEL